MDSSFGPSANFGLIYNKSKLRSDLIEFLQKKLFLPNDSPASKLNCFRRGPKNLCNRCRRPKNHPFSLCEQLFRLFLMIFIPDRCEENPFLFIFINPLEWAWIGLKKPIEAWIPQKREEFNEIPLICVKVQVGVTGFLYILTIRTVTKAILSFLASSIRARTLLTLLSMANMMLLKRGLCPQKGIYFRRQRKNRFCTKSQRGAKVLFFIIISIIDSLILHNLLTISKCKQLYLKEIKSTDFV